MLSDASVDAEPHGVVDFNQAALYMPGLQVLCALLCCCLASILTAVASAAIGTVSAVRTSTVALLVGTAFVWRPVRVSSYVVGVDVMFDALRPCIFVYVGALVLEQLAHSCGAANVVAAPTLRYGIFQLLVLVMAGAGFVQAHHPRRQTDYPFVAVAGALFVIAFFAPPTRTGWSGEGPLCEPPPTARAIERIFRALLFGVTYCALAYASEPARHTVEEVGLCAMRAIVGTVWILCVHRYFLFVAGIQAFVVLWARMRDDKRRHSPALFSPLDTSDPAPPATMVQEMDYAQPEVSYMVDEYGQMLAGADMGVSFHSVANGVPNGAPNGVANGVVNGVANGVTNGVANGLGMTNGLGTTNGRAGGGSSVPSKADMARVAAQIINGADAV